MFTHVARSLIRPASLALVCASAAACALPGLLYGPKDAGGGTDDYLIAFTLKPVAANRFGEWTDGNVGRYLAIVLNGAVRSAPYVKSRITDSGQITGSFTKQQAEDVALTLKSGSLPTPIEVVEEGGYEP